MTAGRDALRVALAEALVSYGIDYAQEASDALLPVVSAWAEQHATRRAAEEIEQLADQRTWVTEHDTEVVSACDLYEQVARLRGELEPVTYDFPPDEDVRCCARCGNAVQYLSSDDLCDGCSATHTSRPLS